MVHTDSGLKAIEDIKIGDKVWSFNETTEEKEIKEVVSLFKNVAYELVEIDIETDTQLANIDDLFSSVVPTINATYTKIVTTPEHPFFVNGNWVKAKDLNIGDLVSTRADSYSKITDIKKFQDELRETYGDVSIDINDGKIAENESSKED